ncbi:MAG: glycosyltransferase family 2 protein [Desulfobacterales bacterium]|nr:glycosyltransferase family 2 protein [Desulfobacterales bacterium]
MRKTIAVALIVKDESRHLDECLKTVEKWANEIVILDSGSTDNTEEISRKYTNKFYVNENWSGFGKQRQIAQTYIESDYIFWLDADERVTEKLRDSIIKVLDNHEENAVYRIPRLSWVFGKYIRHCGWYPDYVTRLYPRKLTGYDDALVHEKVIIKESFKIKKLDGDAIHYTYNDLHHYLVKSAGYAKAWADQREKRGKKSSITKGLTHGLACFIKMYIIKAGFLDGKQGLLLSILSTHSTFIKYADLWIRTEKNKKKAKMM